MCIRDRCVTGLVTIIPQTQFTLFGKVILLILIQIGGLGIIAVSYTHLDVYKRQVGYKAKEANMPKRKELEEIAKFF